MKSYKCYKCLQEINPKDDLIVVHRFDGAVRHKLCPQVQEREAVEHPRHYGGDVTYEVIKVLEAWDLNFHLGNTVKYIARAKHKGNELEDLKKAKWYLERYIALVEK